MKQWISLLIFLVPSILLAQQPIGIINSPNEEVIVRSGKGLGFGKVDELKEGEAFYLWPTDEDWWYVEPMDLGTNDDGGFVPRNEVANYYSENVDDCICPDNERPVFVSQQDQVMACGQILQRNELNQIIIKSFRLLNCADGSQLAYYGNTETCRIRINEADQLTVESLKKLPVGQDWGMRRTAISQQVLVSGKMTKRRMVANPKITSEQAASLLEEVQQFQGKGYVDQTDYQVLLLKMLSTSLSGHTQFESILRSTNEYFGFDFETYYYADLANALALLDWKKRSQ